MHVQFWFLYIGIYIVSCCFSDRPRSLFACDMLSLTILAILSGPILPTLVPFPSFFFLIHSLYRLFDTFFSLQTFSASRTVYTQLLSSGFSSLLFVRLFLSQKFRLLLPRHMSQLVAHMFCISAIHSLH